MPVRANSSPAPVVGSSSGGPSSQRSPASSSGGMSRRAGERMARGGDHHEPAAQERHRRDRGGALGRRRRSEGDVGAAMLEQLGQRFAGHGLDGHVEPRVAGGEGVDQRADVLGHDVGDRHLHEPRLARGVLDRAAGLLGQPEDLGGQRGQAAAPGGERDAAAVADEQLVAELPAQRRHRHRDRRLGHAQFRRRGLDRAQPRHEHERLELGEGHLRSGLSDHLTQLAAPLRSGENPSHGEKGLVPHPPAAGPGARCWKGLRAGPGTI